jgi:flagellar biosynthesis regulator FlaF
MSIRKRTRGRPEKPENKRRSERIAIRCTPAGKKILRQEADRRSVAMTQVIDTIGLEALEAKGRRVPPATIWSWARVWAQTLREKAHDQNLGPEDLRDELRKLSVRLLEKRQAVLRRQEKREVLWERRPEQSLATTVGYRMTPPGQEWVEAKARETGTPKTRMLRRATLEGIRETERFEEIAGRIKTWREGVQDLRSGSRDSGEEIGEEAAWIAQQVEADIEPELIRGRERPSEREGG